MSDLIDKYLQALDTRRSLINFLSDHAHETEKRIVASGDEVYIWKDKIMSDSKLSTDEQLWLMRTVHYHLNEYSEVRGVLTALSGSKNEAMRVFANAELSALQSIGHLKDFAPYIGNTENFYNELLEFESNLDKKSHLKDWIELVLGSTAIVLAICQSSRITNEDVLARVEQMRRIFGSGNESMNLTLDMIERKLSG